MESTITKNQSQEAALLGQSTNQVLVEETKDKIVYYLPCYVRLKIKTVKELEIQKLSGVVSGTLLFSFYYGNLPQQILSQFTEDGKKAILLQLSRQESIELREEKGIIYKEEKSLKMIDYVVRTQFDCHLRGDVFYTPFEIINLNLAITVQTVVLDPDQNNGKRINIKFNCMNTNKVTTIDSSTDCQYGTYSLANYFLDSDYLNSASHRFMPISVIDPDSKIGEKPNKKKNRDIKKKKEEKDEQNEVKGFQDEESNVKMMSTKIKKDKKKIQVKGSVEETDKESKVKNFQYAHFRIPLYKHPGSSLLSIFIPLWVIGFVNLTIFFQDNRLADKIAVIATITLAFIAFLPTINEKIPQTSSIKIVQILIYMELGATLLTLIDAVAIRKEDNLTYDIVWNENGYFILALIINIITVVVVGVLFLMHKFWWEKIYTKQRDVKITVKLIRQNWENKECDEQFKKYTASNRISTIPPDFPKIKIQPPTY